MLESRDSRGIAEETSEDAAAHKKEWDAPTLTTYGDATAITQTGGTVTIDGVGMLS